MGLEVCGNLKLDPSNREFYFNFGQGQEAAMKT